MTIWSVRMSDPTATGAPYLRDGLNVSRYYGAFLLGGLITTLGAIYFFGWRTLAVLGVALLAAALVELLFAWGLRRPLVTEGVLLIVLIYGLLLPPNLPLWMVALGAAVAMLSMALFGGVGYYLFHPALVGKAFLIVLFPQELMNLGVEPLGASSVLLLALIGIWLVMTRAADWRISLVLIATVGVGGALWEMFAPGALGTGGWGALLLAAFLVAPDPVTSPMTLRGKWLYAVALGLLVLVLRGLASVPEGVTFPVLVANAFVPLIDKWTVPRSFGGRR